MPVRRGTRRTAAADLATPTLTSRVADADGGGSRRGRGRGRGRSGRGNGRRGGTPATESEVNRADGGNGGVPRSSPSPSPSRSRSRSRSRSLSRSSDVAQGAKQKGGRRGRPKSSSVSSRRLGLRCRHGGDDGDHDHDDDHDDDHDRDHHLDDSNKNRGNKEDDGDVARHLLTVHSELENLGRALRCPLCLSTLVDPVSLPCLHAFCSSCIRTSLSKATSLVSSKGRGRSGGGSGGVTGNGNGNRNGRDRSADEVDSPSSYAYADKCPVCKVRCNRRGVAPNDHLKDLVKGYKMALRAFGMVPVVYDRSVDMTQIAPTQDDEDDEDDDDEDDEGERDRNEHRENKKGTLGVGGMSIGQKKTVEANSENSTKKTGTTIKGRNATEENHNDKDKDDNGTAKKTKKNKSGPSLEECYEHMEVSQTMRQALRNAAATAASVASNSALPNNKNSSGSNNKYKSTRAVAASVSVPPPSLSSSSSSSSSSYRGRPRRAAAIRAREAFPPPVPFASSRDQLSSSVTASASNVAGTGHATAKGKAAAASSGLASSFSSSSFAAEEMERLNRAKRLEALVQEQERVVDADRRALLRAASMEEKTLGKNQQSSGDDETRTEADAKDATSAKGGDGAKRRVDGVAGVRCDRGDEVEAEEEAKAEEEAEEREMETKAEAEAVATIVVAAAAASHRSVDVSDLTFEETSYSLRRLHRSRLDESSALISHDGRTVVREGRTPRRTERMDGAETPSRTLLLSLSSRGSDVPTPDTADDSPVVVNDGNTMVRSTRKRGGGEGGRTEKKKPAAGNEETKDGAAVNATTTTTTRSSKASLSGEKIAGTKTDAGHAVAVPSPFGGGDNGDGNAVEEHFSADDAGDDRDNDSDAPTMTQDAREKEAADRSFEDLMEEEEKKEENERLAKDDAVSSGRRGEANVSAEGAGMEPGKGTTGEGRKSAATAETAIGAADVGPVARAADFITANEDEETDPMAAAEAAKITITTTKTTTVEVYPVGLVVRVQSRTWPGVNKPGGVARIVKVHDDGGGVRRYDVAYVLGGKEKGVDSAFVERHEEGQNQFGVSAASSTETTPETSSVGAEKAEEEKGGGGKTRRAVGRPRRSRRCRATAAAAVDNASEISEEPMRAARTGKAPSKRAKALSSDAAAAPLEADPEREEPKQGKRSATSAAAASAECAEESASRPKRKGRGGTEERSINVGTPPGAKRRKTTGERSDAVAEKSPAPVPTSTATEQKASRSKAKGKKRKDPSESSPLSGPASGRRGAKTAPAPALLDSEKMSLAEERYAHLFNACDMSLAVVTSSLSEYDQGLIKVLALELKKSSGFNVKVDTEFHPNKTSVCITPLAPDRSSDRGKKKNKLQQTSQFRTLKTMRAALAGVPIVSPSWITLCLHEKRLVLPAGELCAWSLPTKADRLVPFDSNRLAEEPTAALAVSNYAALLHKREKHDGDDFGIRILPLEGVHVVLCGTWKKGEGAPLKVDAQSLLREAGASILPSAGAAVKMLRGNHFANPLVILCDETKSGPGGIVDSLFKAAQESMEKDSSSRTIVVNSNWLFDCISCGTLLGAVEYEPASPRAKLLWRLCVGN